MEQIDLGPCPALLHEGERERCAILLPGARYPTRAPLLWFAREAALERGWSVLEVLDELPPDAQGFEWALDRSERALAAAPTGQLVMIGKSLTSVAAGLAADRDLPAIWLTPLMREARVTEALARAAQFTLLVGGTADPLWDRDAVPANPAIETVELEGLDHALQVPGDAEASLRALGDATRAVTGFLEPLAQS